MSIYGTPVTASKNNTYFPGENISITDNKISTKAFPCNPNLLDNWYFGNPVDQRNGYVVYDGANLYTDATCTTVAGTASGGPYQAYPISSICVSFTTNATYYCKIGDAGVVRGYTGGGYTIDRWKLFVSGSVAITDGGLQFSSAVNFGQVLEGSRAPNGIKATASVLTDEGLASVTFSPSGEAQQIFSAVVGGTSLYFTCNWGGSDNHLIMLDGSGLVKAVKLELGSQQTLAHQENGAWVLNEIPDYGDQLRRCQRYLIDIAGKYPIIQSFASNGSWFSIQLPCDMRTTPSFITQDVSRVQVLRNGVTVPGVTFDWNTASFAAGRTIIVSSNLSGQFADCLAIDSRSVFASAEL